MLSFVLWNSSNTIIKSKLINTAIQFLTARHHSTSLLISPPSCVICVWILVRDKPWASVETVATHSDPLPWQDSFVTVPDSPCPLFLSKTGHLLHAPVILSSFCKGGTRHTISHYTTFSNRWISPAKPRTEYFGGMDYGNECGNPAIWNLMGM